ncbi:LemA family protein [Lacticaseibacillus thailandensis]|uniref:LemA family protein n=1 Tax=Lacticaseibacillus thailandensis DSM 22698 = JCM 13996 TaxID=1423810 RepID=A0A0R2CHB9_9LACO|nr:LemA family protein [Lacticaseibacillus thailandensis]KRM87612.1 hypothetical protein FD19_GL001125 [Lacticaseibacillus thailandensis DSM 22698 = JCM 13996]
MDMKKLSGGAIAGIIVAAVVVILAIFGISAYNSIVKADQQVTEQWSQVENVTQRQYDLIPNLVSSVKGSMQQEQKVFGAIADARKDYAKADTTKDKANATAEMTSSVGTLISVIRENYPTLNSNKQVSTLMSELEGSQNRISVERRRYNQDVQAYNNKIVTFPKNIIANMMGKGTKAYFKADSKAMNSTPSVDLDTDSSSTSGK